MVFRLLMDDAVAHRPPLLKHSPVPAPNRRRGKYVRPPKPEAVIGSPAQVLELAENARTVWGPAGFVAVLTKAFCGLRQGELYGLRREWCYPYWPWSDPGWPGNPDGRKADRTRQQRARERYGSMPALRVQWQHQYVRPPEGGSRVPTLTDPKYGSRRDLVLPPFLAGMLAELLEEHDSEWVFPSLDGKSLLLTDFSTYYWQPIVAGANERTGRYARPKIPAVEGLEGMVPHGLRHGMKVWLDEGGQHSRVAVEERMGHRLQGVEGVYSQVTPAMERRIAVDLQGMWERCRGGG
jgi:integrase